MKDPTPFADALMSEFKRRGYEVSMFHDLPRGIWHIWKDGTDEAAFFSNEASMWLTVIELCDLVIEIWQGDEDDGRRSSDAG